jgi:hypothetical protein
VRGDGNVVRGGLGDDRLNVAGDGNRARGGRGDDVVVRDPKFTPDGAVDSRGLPLPARVRA